MVHEETGGGGDYVKARQIVGEKITILAGDFQEGKFGPEVLYQIRRADGSPAQLSLSRRPFREQGLARIWTALESSPQGVPAKLRKLEPDRDGTEFEVFLFDPFEVGRQPSPERVAWERQQAGEDPSDEDLRQFAAVFADDPGPREADAPSPHDFAMGD
ncbi:MAG: hypothetical protein ACREN4_06445 [Candidatus Dormibacteria bacterium]